MAKLFAKFFCNLTPQNVLVKTDICNLSLLEVSYYMTHIASILLPNIFSWKTTQIGIFSGQKVFWLKKRTNCYWTPWDVSNYRIILAKSFGTKSCTRCQNIQFKLWAVFSGSITQLSVRDNKSHYSWAVFVSRPFLIIS